MKAGVAKERPTVGALVRTGTRQGSDSRQRHATSPVRDRVVLSTTNAATKDQTVSRLTSVHGVESQGPSPKGPSRESRDRERPRTSGRDESGRTGDSLEARARHRHARPSSQGSRSSGPDRTRLDLTRQGPSREVRGVDGERGGVGRVGGGQLGRGVPCLALPPPVEPVHTVQRSARTPSPSSSACPCAGPARPRRQRARTGRLWKSCGLYGLRVLLHYMLRV